MLTTLQKNAVLEELARQVSLQRADLLAANERDMANIRETEAGQDKALIERLAISASKVEGMIEALRQVIIRPDPVNRILDSRVLDNGLRVENRTVPFGTLLIIYESRPDVTIEASCLAFKAGNRILLKGGREAVHTNQALVSAWQSALNSEGLPSDWVRLLTLSREQTEALLQRPTERIDLIVPRGGESLIRMVKTYAQCPVLVSGRGNNFLLVDESAEWTMAVALIENGKLQKRSACNALDKVLIHSNLPELANRLTELINRLAAHGVKIWLDESAASCLQSASEGDSDSTTSWSRLDDERLWETEFLDDKIVIGVVPDCEAAVERINRSSGGHSASIVSRDAGSVEAFMNEVDCAVVYRNASTRFTDGGQMGLGAELAISTDKLHHRGPLGLEQLVSNKYFVYGDGQIRP
jgi:glutamate-5-semialdehyde dehydrogenase